MDIRTKRIAKTAALGAVKLFFIIIAIVVISFVVFYASMMMTGQVWPIVLVFCVICFCITIWDWARLKVEIEMREEERLMRILGQNQDQ